MIGTLLVIAAAIGCFIYAFERWKARELAPRTDGWPKAEGVITHSERIEGFAHTGKPESSKIRYTYSVGSIVYNGSNVGLLDTRTSLQSMWAIYPQGRAVTVFYNPENHSEAYLEAGKNSQLFTYGPIGTALFWTSQVGIIAFGILVFVIALLPK